MADSDHFLEGGYMSSVVRRGNTVRRPKKPWSATVMGLLRHLRERGFAGVPLPIGFDDEGREVLEFVEGEPGNYPLAPYMTSETVLVEAARLLRDFHDATLSYRAPRDAIWQFSDPDEREHEVICHNDFAPYNMVFREQRLRAIIDFDTAGPGPRIWDVAYAAYRFVPLSADPHSEALGWRLPYDRGELLRAFCDSYGLERPETLLPTVERRLEALLSLIAQGAAAGDPRFEQVMAEGHHENYQRDISFINHNRRLLAQALDN